jgi:glyoxylase-like metal-dependent hydrolase (beta-lactamase superfamily II)
MKKKAFQFAIGDFKCLVVDDGYIVQLDPPGQEPSQPGGPGSQILDINCLVVQSGDRRVLIDTGGGEGNDPTAGYLLHNLREAGIKPSEIDFVVITHAHWDHLGGCTDSAGRALYPNARYLLHQNDWDYWIKTLDPATVEEQRKRSLTAARKNLLPLGQHLELIKDGREILPGMKLVLAEGHTPGHILVELSSSGQRLLCIGDLMHHTLEFARPEFYTLFDVVPKRALSNRDEILSDAVKSGVLIFSYHLPFPGLGRFVKKGRRFSWQPAVPVGNF